MHQRYNPDGVWGPNGRAFNQGIVQGPGRVVHITGQVAWDAHHRVIGTGDVARQFDQCVDNIRRILEPVGGRLGDIVSMTVYFLRREDLPAIQAARARHFPPADAPASILIQVPGLVIDDFLVELVPIAVVPDERFRAISAPA
jgi:enamine deaminase RidA (YjgF/YER057c/UK114 family)